MQSINKLPVEIVFSPSWWYKHTGITFDKDFFFNPRKRVESERRMELELYNRFGKYGLGAEHSKDVPQLGAVHLASGYLLSEMLGCEVIYSESAPPQVVCANQAELSVDTEKAFSSSIFKEVEKLADALKAQYGYLRGDINWSGVLNLALDLRGESIFMDMMMEPEKVKQYFGQLAEVCEKFTRYVEALTGSTSISVNRNVINLAKPVLLHSECSHTMISEEMYEEFLLPIDAKWSAEHAAFGIHHCGKDPHRFAAAYAKLPHLAFLDLGWGGDVKLLREHLPNTFLNIRLDPVTIGSQSLSEIENSIVKLVGESNDPMQTGVCCINMDDKVSDEKVIAIFETATRVVNG
ncbi:MAG: hypothetical protein LBU92_00855 [Prevotellaceae bacterium]|jgi:hypothetical protein|nr:hypothetical protein [Prevotellaceae bacterium]